MGSWFETCSECMDRIEMETMSEANGERYRIWKEWHHDGWCTVPFIEQLELFDDSRKTS